MHHSNLTMGMHGANGTNHTTMTPHHHTDGGGHSGHGTQGSGHDTHNMAGHAGAGHMVSHVT